MYYYKYVDEAGALTGLDARETPAVEPPESMQAITGAEYAALLDQIQ